MHFCDPTCKSTLLSPQDHNLFDLISKILSDGEQGLRQAIWSFDESVGTRFEKWARTKIKKAISEGGRKEVVA